MNFEILRNSNFTREKIIKSIENSSIDFISIANEVNKFCKTILSWEYANEIDIQVATKILNILKKNGYKGDV